jgi:ACS family allantoate permease-like MFS transporter
MALLLIIRWYLSSENKRRDAEPIDDSYVDTYINIVGKDGQTHKAKVSKVRIREFYAVSR